MDTKRYFKEAKKVNEGKMSFVDFIDKCVFWENAHKDWYNLMAGYRVFKEDGGDLSKIKDELEYLNKTIDFPKGISIDTDF